MKFTIMHKVLRSISSSHHILLPTKSAQSVNTNLNNVNLVKPSLFQRKYCSSNHPSHVKTEVLIPTLQGNIAGILWTPSTSSENVQNPQEPPIVCMHGHLDNLGTFDPLIPLILKENRTIFAYDFAGHGQSFHTGGAYYDHFFEGLVSIQRVLNHFKWKKVSFLGHSLGAQVGFLHAGVYPDAVHKYVSLDNLRPVINPIEEFHNVYKWDISSLFKTESTLKSGKERRSYEYEEMVKANFESRKGTVGIEGCRALIARSSKKVPGTQNRYRYTHDIKLNIPHSFRFLTSSHLDVIGRRVKCPVCFIKGEPGEDYEPRENLLKFVDNLKKTNPSPVEYHTIPGTHHFHLNSPELVAPIVNRFLES